MSEDQQPMQEGMNEDQSQNQNHSQADQSQTAGRRHRRHSKKYRNHKNSWLSHVKSTMKQNRGMSFKQVLKLAKRSYKKSHSQNGGKHSKSLKNLKGPQNGGSAAKTSNFGDNAAAYPSR